MACCMLEPSHYLNQCQHTIKGYLQNSPGGIFTGSAQDINQWNVFKYYTFQIISTSPNGQWVDISKQKVLHDPHSYPWEMFKKSRPVDACMLHLTRPLLFQLIACCLFSATTCIDEKNTYFLWKCCVQNVGHFVQDSTLVTMLLIFSSNMQRNFIKHLLVDNTCSINSLGPSDVIWQHRTGSTLALVIPCCLVAPRQYLN